MRWHAKIPAALASALLLQGAFAAETDDDRRVVYREYRDAFDSRNYQRALPLAVRVVDLTANEYGTDAIEMAGPLTNLGTTLYRLGEYGEALDTYRRALYLVENEGDPTDPRLIAPLHGLGASLRGMQRDEEAIVPLKRAVDIVRNRDGLHAPAQLPLLHPLIEAYEATWRYDDASREHQYAFNVAEQAWGADDPRMIAQLEELARWNEKVGRYTAARVMYARAVQLADREKPGSLKAVASLRGIARTYRLAYINGESQESVVATSSELPQSMATAPLMMNAPSGEGERALRNALQRLEPAGASKAAERGQVLIDLGDWYRIAGAGSRAMSSWTQAWTELTAAGDTSALSRPAPIVYRAPSMAVSQRHQDPAEYDVQEVNLQLAVAADGDVRNATVTNPSPERDAAERAVVTAVRRGTWRPAFAGGVAVPDNDFTFSEKVYVRLKPEKTSDTG